MSLDLAKKLIKIPITEKGIEIPKIQVSKPNVIQQMDLLFLPSDMGFKYLLVVVDCGSRLTDFQQLKSKTATACLSALKKIYARKIIEIPHYMRCDPGSEFKGAVKMWFLDNDCIMKYSKVGRSRQVGLAESRNKSIQAIILTNQLVKEIESGKINRQWVKDLPAIRDELNKKFGHQSKPREQKILITDRNNKLLDVGTKVRVILDKPHNYFGKKLHGTFRTGDIRWSPIEREIEKLILNPGQPPMYLVEGIPNTAYTYNQLQIV
jgi:hypothetical protein